MVKYTLVRLFWFIPGVFIVSLLAFVISVNAPGDPVDVMMAGEAEADMDEPGMEVAIRKEWRERLGLDLPLFYISLTSLSTPSNAMTANLTPEERLAVNKLAFVSGNGTNSVLMHASFTGMWDTLAADTGRVAETVREQALVRINSLKTADSEPEIQQMMDEIRKLKIIDPVFNQKFILSDKLFRQWRIETSFWKSWTPKIMFHGDNRYHRWLLGDPTGYSKGILRGDFGISLHTKQPIAEILFSKFKWSALLATLSVILAFMISVPLGVWAGARPGSWFDRIINFKLFALYCIPSFWMGTILLMLFANPDVLKWFPASGITPPGGFPKDSGFINKLQIAMPYLVLPTICYMYATMAFTARIIRASVRENMMQDHIRTAKAKGLTLPRIAFKHAFRNSLLPAITVLTEVFPIAIGGSVIIETIFGIPGMGYETIQAVFTLYYTMIVAICTLSVLLTMAGTLMCDLLYG
ncbi:MAG: ABC transporter permease, partial [Bacteroidota bacterium]